MTERDPLAEHAVRQTDTVTAYYPAHPPRTASNVYAKSHTSLVVAQNKPCWACGITHQDILDRTTPSIAPGLAMETHHFWTEDAFTGEGRGLGGIYWPRVMSDHPTFDWAGSGFELDDPATWKHFVDSEFNLQVLCLHPESRVLMADGRHVAIADVAPGDYVVGGDLRPHRVIASMSREYRGAMVRFGALAVTPEHPVLTDVGWLPAAHVRSTHHLGEVGMGIAQMLGMGRIEPQVLQAIVEAVPVHMVDDFGGEKGPAEVTLQDDSMLGRRLNLIARPNLHPAVAIARNRARAATAILRAVGRNLQERAHAALIGAELLEVVAGSGHGRPASFAGDGRWPSLSLFGLPGSATGVRAGGVSRREVRMDAVRRPAPHASRLDPGVGAAGEARWRPVGDINVQSHVGRVYDLEVEGAHSFVADGLIVHNCSACHRAAQPVPHWLAGLPDINRGGLVWPADAASIGIHHATYPEFRDQRHSRPDVPPFRTALAVPPPVPALA